MIVGLGVDLTEISRIAKAQQKNAQFARKILTDNELAVYETYHGSRAIEYLAGRFAVKEAFSKAFGTGLGTVGLHAIETLDDPLGKPMVTQSLFEGIVHVSLAHTGELVMAEVILEREG